MTTPTPAELRELASKGVDAVYGEDAVLEMQTALRACADLIERMPDVEKLRGLVVRMNDHASNDDLNDGWRFASAGWRDLLAALLPNNNEEPK